MPNSVMTSRSRETWKKACVTISNLAMLLLAVVRTRYQMGTFTSELHTQGYNITNQKLEKCSDNTEDAGGLSYRHFPLFPPFTLAQYLPTSLLLSFQSAHNYIQHEMEYRQLSFFSNGNRHSTAAHFSGYHSNAAHRRLSEVLRFPLFQENVSKTSL